MHMMGTCVVLIIDITSCEQVGEGVLRIYIRGLCVGLYRYIIVSE